MKAFGLLGMLVCAIIGMIYFSKTSTSTTESPTGPMETAEIPAFANDVAKKANAHSQRQKEAAAEALRQVMK